MRNTLEECKAQEYHSMFLMHCSLGSLACRLAHCLRYDETGNYTRQTELVTLSAWRGREGGSQLLFNSPPCLPLSLSSFVPLSLLLESLQILLPLLILPRNDIYHRQQRQRRGERLKSGAMKQNSRSLAPSSPVSKFHFGVSTYA